MIDFRIHYMTEGRPVWIKTKMFSECTEAEQMQANLRSIFQDEIVLDFESMPELENGKKKLLEEGISFIIAKSPRGGHVHIKFTELTKFTKQERNAIRSAFIQHYGADEAKSSEDTLISMPGKVHFKTKDFISTVENHVVGENTLPQYALIGLCLAPSVKVIELLRGVEQGCRDDSAIKLATYFRKMGKPREDAEKLLLDWNKKNKPPMEEREIKAKIKGAYDRDQPYGWTFVDERNNGFSVSPVSELMKQYEGWKPVWLVDGLIPEGSITLWVGRRASFKSWLISSIAGAISRGDMWLGKFRTKKSNILIIDAENAPALLADRMIKTGCGPGVFYYAGDGFSFERDTDAVIAECKRLSIDIVALDTLRRGHGFDENDAEQVSRLFKDYLFKFKTAGITLILVYHTKKQQQGASLTDENDMIRGSGEFANLVDVVVFTGRHGINPIVNIKQTKNRFAQEMEAFNVHVSILDGKAVFTPVLDEGPITMPSVLAEKFRRYLETRARGEVIPLEVFKEIANKLELKSRETMHKAVRMLIANGDIEHSSKGVYKIRSIGQQKL